MPPANTPHTPETGLDIHTTPVPTLDGFTPDPTPGASRYRHTLPGGEHFDALLVNRESDILVVTLHGATDRAKTVLPRFERLRTMGQWPVSTMYFADPALWRNDVIQLAWYTGWDGFDGHQAVADWAVTAARAVGATRILFTGSSGGGFAALQVSALVDGSTALAFNPQTSIHGYLADNQYWGPQKYYLKTVWPELAPDGIDAVDYSQDWTRPLGDRVSALRRYARPTGNHVHFVINRNEFHYDKHYLPFLGAAALGGNLDRATAHEYAGGTRHNPPLPDVFNHAMQETIDAVTSRPPALISTPAPPR